MTRCRPLAAAIALAFVLAVPVARAAEVVANTGTTKIDFTPREWLDVGLTVNGVTIDRIRLKQAGRVTSLVLKHDEANRGRIVVTNASTNRISPSVAVAVFDEEGHLLAAANTGIRLKAINPGETREMDIHFGGVFRHLDKGRTLYVSLEF